MNMDEIDKLAQARNVFKQLGRTLNPMEYIRYHGYDSYRRVYDEITLVDNEMRQEAKSAKQDMNDFIHQARMAMKNREYPKVMYYAWQVIESLDRISDPVNRLENLQKEMISEYYNEQNIGNKEISEMHKSLSTKDVKSSDMRKLLYATAAPNIELTANLISKAGPIQWLKENIPTYRQMEGSMLDRIFRNKLHNQKEAARKALRIAERAFQTMKDVFVQLDTYRTEFSSYLDTAKRFQSKISSFKQEISNMYQDNFAETVSELMKRQETADKPTENPATIEGPQESTNNEVVVDNSAQMPNAQSCTNCQSLNPLDATTCDKCGGKLTPFYAEQPSQLAFDFGEGWSMAAPQQEKEVAAEYVANLAKLARLEVMRGNANIAGVLLVKASEICDRYNDEASAVKFLKAAERMLR